MSSFCSSAQSTSVLIILHNFLPSANFITSLFTPFPKITVSNSTDVCRHLLIPSLCCDRCQLIPPLCSSLWVKSLTPWVSSFLRALVEESYQKPVAHTSTRSRSVHHIYGLIDAVTDVRHSHYKSCIDFSCIFLCVCKFCSLFLLTCLMPKSNQVTCVSPGCAGIPLKMDIIAITQSFGAEAALGNSLSTP